MDRAVLEEIMKFERPAQFPVDEILNEDERIVRGWMSVEVKDKQGEIIPLKELKKTLNTWMKRGGFITDQHTNRVVGKALRWYEAKHPKTGQPGIIIEYQIFKDYSIDDQVWEEIKSGKRKGLSFGGRALKKPKLLKDRYTGQPAKALTGIEAYEVASVVEPANQFAENIAVNYLAKSAKSKDFNEIPKSLKNKLSLEVYGMEWDELSDGEKEEVYQRYLATKNVDKEGVNVEKKVVKRGDKWCVIHCHGPDKGKPIKCFNTKEEALRMHRAIMANKELVFKDEEGVRMRDILAEEIYGKKFDELSDEQKKKIHQIAVRVWSKKGDNMSEVYKPKDRKPPKDWWDRCVRSVGEVSSVDDPNALCGWVWYHHMKKGMLNKSPEEWSDEELKEQIRQAVKLLEESLEAKNLKTMKKNESKGDNMKQDENAKKPENEEELEEETTEEKDEEAGLKDRITALEQKIDQIINFLSQKLKSEEGEGEGEKAEAEGESGGEEGKEGETAEKQNPEGGKVILPKSPTGETDEKAKPESDEVRVMEKQIEKAVKKVLEKYNITKATTPRTYDEIVKNKEEEKKDFALELMKKVREGKMTLADMNREIKKFVKKQYEEGLKKVLAREG